MDVSAIKNRVCVRIDEIAPEAVEVAEALFNKPELAYEEFFAAEHLTQNLKKHGLKVEIPYGGIQTAFCGNLGSNNGKRVAVLAEYDALPEIGHACGHHLIAAAAYAAVIGAAAVIKETGGMVSIVGTPAEEGGGGKVRMIEQGVFKNFDAAIMAHPSSRNIAGRNSLAIREVIFKFYGKEAHASAAPEKGVNALDGVIQTFNGINALRQHVRSDVRIHGIITCGGQKPNIVPGYAEAVFYVRASEDSYLDEVMKKVINCARGGESASGARLEIEYGSAYKNMKPDAVLCGFIEKNMQTLGMKIEVVEGGVGSTDMGDVSHELPAAHPYFSITGGADVPFHSKEFLEIANTKEAYDSMINAAKMLALTVVDVLLSE